MNRNIVAQHSPCINNHRSDETKNGGFYLHPLKPLQFRWCSVLNLDIIKQKLVPVTWHCQSAFCNDKLLYRTNRSHHTSQTSYCHFIHGTLVTNILIWSRWTNIFWVSYMISESNSENSEVNVVLNWLLSFLRPSRSAFYDAPDNTLVSIHCTF